MKIEKLTENKIRIILSLDDLKKHHINLNSFLINPLESQDFFERLLDKVEKEFNFKIKNHKLLIESNNSFDEFGVITITKYKLKDNSYSSNCKRYTMSKRTVSTTIDSINEPFKNMKNNKKSTIFYIFNSFEEFCSFCTYIDSLNLNLSKDFSTDVSLYVYNNKFYLCLTNINPKFKYLDQFYALISEFADRLVTSNNFESKLMEHGKILIKKNAIARCIKYFVKQK